MAQPHPIKNDVIMLVTTVTKNRIHLFSNPAFAREAIERLYRVQEIHPFFLHAFVIMPDHCHILLNVPAPESISRVMHSYKTGLVLDFGLYKNIWQPRFHLRIVHNASRVMSYVHQNPVRAEIVEIAKDYPWSSACGKWDITPLGFNQ